MLGIQHPRFMSYPTKVVLLGSICLFASILPLKSDCLADLSYLQDCVAQRDIIYMDKAMYRYAVSGRKETRLMLEQLSTLEATLGKALAEAGVPDWLKYLPLAESRLQSKAVSPAGAAGLWQIMPRTARSLGLKINRRVDERLDTHKASLAAARYLKNLHLQFDDWLLALAAYNCGPGNVRKAQRRSGGYFYHEISRYLPRQTRRYIPRVLTIARIAQDPEYFGFSDLEQRSPAVTVVVKSAMSLPEIASYYCTSARQLYRLNPGLLTGRISYTQVPLRILVPGDDYFRGERISVMRVAEHLEGEEELESPWRTQAQDSDQVIAGWEGDCRTKRFWCWGRG